LSFRESAKKPLAFPGGLNFAFFRKQCLSPEMQEKNTIFLLNLISLSKPNAALIFFYFQA